MDAQQYKLTLEGLKSPNAQNLHELAQWAENECIPWTWAELGGIVGEKKLSALAPPHTIRQGLQVSFADREQMPLTKTFYIAQLSMFERETKRHCEACGTLFPGSPVVEELPPFQHRHHASGPLLLGGGHNSQANRSMWRRYEAAKIRPV